MDLIKFQDCLESELSTIEVVPGTLILCRDSGLFYYDNLEGTRVPVAQNVKLLEYESNRLNLLTPETGVIYIVTSTLRSYVYLDGYGWKPLNRPSDIYIRNVFVAAGAKFVGFYDSRIEQVIAGNTIAQKGEFIPIDSISALIDTNLVTVDCTAGSGWVYVDNNTEYPLMGTIRVYYDYTL